VRRLLVVVCVLAAVAVSAGIALAGMAGNGLVSEQAVAYTPNVLDGSVDAMTVVGDTVVVGGDFTAVAAAGTGERYDRNYLFAYRMTTGQVLPFAPDVDGPVRALAAGPGGSVFVASQNRSLMRYDLESGATAPAPVVNDGQIHTMLAVGPWLYLGGTFTHVDGAARTALARTFAATGDLDDGLDIPLTFSSPSPDFQVKVESLAATADGARLAVAGAFTSAAGEPRSQLFIADTTGATAAVAGWSTDAYTGNCASAYDTYLRDVDFAPDGSYLAVVATGRLTGPDRMCDSAARFDVAGAGNHKPVWVNYTGGNSLWSVTVSGSAVYVGGHQQWMNNPQGDKTAGPGAVSRPGIAALDPATGDALSWDPTHSRGVGIRVLLTCSAGLLIGSDTDDLSHTYHGRIGMLPNK